MGQQQLLLLVLGIVIVGLAVVVGISAFAENRHKSTVDRYTATGVGMASEIIAFYKKPETMGGGGESSTALASMDAGDLGYTEDVSDTWNGFPRSGVVDAGYVRYVSASATTPFIHMHELPLKNGDTRVEVYAFGPSSECIVTRSNIYGVQDTWTDGRADGAPPDNPNSAVCSW